MNLHEECYIILFFVLFAIYFFSHPKSTEFYVLFHALIRHTYFMLIDSSPPPPPPFSHNFMPSNYQDCLDIELDQIYVL